jgi:hypothetical protein
VFGTPTVDAVLAAGAALAETDGEILGEVEAPLELALGGGSMLDAGFTVPLGGGTADPLALGVDAGAAVALAAPPLVALADGTPPLGAVPEPLGAPPASASPGTPDSHCSISGSSGPGWSKPKNGMTYSARKSASDGPWSPPREANASSTTKPHGFCQRKRVA